MEKLLKNVNDGRLFTEKQVVEMYKREFIANNVSKNNYSNCQTIEELIDKTHELNDDAARDWVQDDDCFVYDDIDEDEEEE